MGLPKLMAARSVPLGANSERKAAGGGAAQAEISAAPHYDSNPGRARISMAGMEWIKRIEWMD